jgi:hypothetical protein
VLFFFGAEYESCVFFPLLVFPVLHCTCFCTVTCTSVAGDTALRCGNVESVGVLAAFVRACVCVYVYVYVYVSNM